MFGNIWDVNGRFRQPFCYRQGKDSTSSLLSGKKKHLVPSAGKEPSLRIDRASSRHVMPNLTNYPVAAAAIS